MNHTANPVYKFILSVKEFGLEVAARRWYSIYQGKVSTVVNGRPGNVDGRQQGRISVNVPDLGIGEKVGATFVSSDLPFTALPISPYAGNDHGFYFPPETGDSVWVSFEYGNTHQPRYLGGWWGNPAAGDNNSTLSELPKEFQSVSGQSPSARGIKTGRGHGLLFEDSSLAPYVALWSGKSVPGQVASRNQLILLSEDPSDAGIKLNTFYGFFAKMNDTTRKFTLSGKPKDPAGVLANSIEIDDNLNTITVKSNNPAQSIVIDGTTLAITVTSPGATNITSVGPVNIASASAAIIAATGGIAIGSGATPPAPPVPGAAVETGVGAKIVTYGGAWTETIGGAFVQTVAGALSMTAAAMNLSAAVLNLAGNIVVTGTAQFGSGTPQQLVHQQIIDLIVNHTHPTAAPGPPSTSPALAVLGTSASPAPAYVTSDLKGS